MKANTAKPIVAHDRDRRKFLAAGGALVLAGCAVKPLGTFEPVEVTAPSWRVGERWTYRRTDFYTKLDAGTVTREVVSVGPSGTRVLTRTLQGQVLDDTTYSAPGIVVFGNLSEDSPTIAGTLSPPFERYAFPLTSGKQWQQHMTRTDRGGFRNSLTTSTRVEGWETVNAAGREVRAILIRRQLYLGPKDEFHGPLYRYELEWYAPELGGTARLQMEEWYRETRFLYGGIGYLSTGSRYLYELASYAPA